MIKLIIFIKFLISLVVFLCAIGGIIAITLYTQRADPVTLLWVVGLSFATIAFSLLSAWAWERGS